MMCSRDLKALPPTYLVGLVVVRDEFVKADDLAVEDCHAVKGLGHHA